MITVDKTELIHRILSLQERIGRRMHNDAPDAWMTLNLTIAQLKSMLFINFEGVTNFKMLAEALKVTPPNVTGIIERLVEQGLVSRASNEQNRRTQNLKLTTKGVSLLAQLRERSTSHFAGILASLSVEDLLALVQGLNALANALEKSPKNTNNNEVLI